MSNNKWLSRDAPGGSGSALNNRLPAPRDVTCPAASVGLPWFAHAWLCVFLYTDIASHHRFKNSFWHLFCTVAGKGQILLFYSFIFFDWKWVKFVAVRLLGQTDNNEVQPNSAARQLFCCCDQQTNYQTFMINRLHSVQLNC